MGQARGVKMAPVSNSSNRWTFFVRRARQAVRGALILVGISGAQAATQVSGTIVNQIWTASGSPYEVIGDVLVASLVIRPGVEVRFMGNFVFEVAGSLNAVGEASAMIHFRPSNASVGWQGLLFNESPRGSTLEYCRVEGSKNSGVRILNSLPVIRRCVFAGNSTTNVGSGGGLVATLQGGRIEILSCVVTNNRTIGQGSAGAGLAIRGGTMVVSNSLIAHNVSAFIGGGLWVRTGAKLLVANSIITSNRALNGGGAHAWNGGGIDASLDFNNCTITKNEPDAISLDYSTTCTVSNSIVYQNGTGSWIRQESSSQVTVAYSNTQGGTPFAGVGNKASNPVLNPATFEILPGSPCIDAGNPGAAYNDVCFPPSLGGVRNDMGAFGGPGACLGVGIVSGDSDADGLPDDWEILYFGGITAQTDSSDPDQDKLSNAEEHKAGTDPSKLDTDGDGYSDFAELRLKSDPLDHTSVPPAGLEITVEQIRLEFVAALNEKVVIQKSSDLLSWPDVEPITGKGEVVTRVYNVSEGYRFYRLARP
jgi:hypothetical protein